MYLVSLSEQQLAVYSKHNSGRKDGLMDSFRNRNLRFSRAIFASSFRNRRVLSRASNEAGYMGNHI